MKKYVLFVLVAPCAFWHGLKAEGTSAGLTAHDRQQIQQEIQAAEKAQHFTNNLKMFESLFVNAKTPEAMKQASIYYNDAIKAGDFPESAADPLSFILTEIYTDHGADAAQGVRLLAEVYKRPVGHKVDLVKFINQFCGDLYIQSHSYVQGVLDVLQALVDVGWVDIHKVAPVQGGTKMTPLMVAANCAALPVVDFLLRHGANPNIRVPGMGTALYRACYSVWDNFNGSLEPNFRRASERNPYIPYLNAICNVIVRLLRSGAQVTPWCTDSMEQIRDAFGFPSRSRTGKRLAQVIQMLQDTYKKQQATVSKDTKKRKNPEVFGKK